jgi:HAD superfamily hydrolase (TIGR01509 family)
MVPHGIGRERGVEYLVAMLLHIPAGEFAAYLFDLDGTLIDSMPVHFRAWERALQQVGLAAPFDVEFFYSLGGTPTLESAVIFREHYGLSFDAPQLVIDKEHRYLDLLHEVTLIEPVVSIARRVAQTYPVAIVTGGGPEIAYPALEASGLRSLFPVVITPEDVAPGRGKPHPDMFLLAAEKLGVPAGSCLVFEDALPGLAAAQAAGMQVVLVPRTS